MNEHCNKFDNNYNVIDMTKKVQESTKVFPFSKLNPPPSNAWIPIYIGDGENLIQKNLSFQTVQKLLF